MKQKFKSMQSNRRVKVVHGFENNYLEVVQAAMYDTFLVCYIRVCKKILNFV